MTSFDIATSMANFTIPTGECPVLPDASDVKDGVDRGDGVVGTYPTTEATIAATPKASIFPIGQRKVESIMKLRGQTRVTLDGTSRTIAELLATATHDGAVTEVLSNVTRIGLKPDATGCYWQLGGTASTLSDPIGTGGIEIETTHGDAVTIEVFGTGGLTIYQS